MTEQSSECNMDIVERSVVSFVSDQFPYIFPGDSAEPNEPPAGRDVAWFFQSELIKRDVRTTLDEPVSGEGGWHFKVALDESTYKIYM